MRPVISRLSRRAFTLIELLVVIAIIAVLAAIIFPVFTHVREKARQTACLSNLRQIDLAWQMYTDDYDETACPTYFYIPNSVGGVSEEGWDFTLNYDASFNLASTSPGLLDPYTSSGRINQCPDFHGPTNGRPYTGYSYNATYAGGDFAYPSGPVTRPACIISQILDPDHMALFADGGDIGFPSDGTVHGDNYMRAPSDPDNFGLDYGLIDFRHQKTADVAYADGHVHSVTTEYDVNSAVPELGTLSSDDSAYDFGQ